MATAVFYVDSGPDDARETEGVVVSDSAILVLASPDWFGLLFDVSFPDDVVITSAILRLNGPQGYSIINPYFKLWGSNAAIYPPLQNFVDDPRIGLRPKTSASLTVVGATYIPPAGSDYYISMDVTTIVQQTGWNNGAGKVAFYGFNLSTERYLSLYFFEHAGTSMSASLTVTYYADIIIDDAVTGSIALVGEPGSSGLVTYIDATGTTGSIALTGSTGEGLSEAILADGPVVYWKMDEPSGLVANDTSGGVAHNGTYTGGVTLAQPSIIPSTRRTAADFEANDTEYIAVADHAELDLGDTLTMEIVASIESLPASSVRSLISKGTGAYQLRVSQSGTNTGVLQFVRQGVAVIASSTILLGLATPYHIVATKSGATVKIYVNGVDVTGTVTNSTMVNTTGALEVGRQSGTGSPWDGQLQDFALYNTALSLARVTAHYTAYADPATILVFIESGGETGSIAIVGNEGSANTFAPDDDLTYGGFGTYGGDGLYDGPTLEPPPDAGRTRIDIYGPDGEKLAIPPLTTFTATYMDGIDEVGSFSYTIPAALESAALVTQGMRLHLYVEGEGEVFRGIAREFTWEDGPEGDPRLRIEGPSIGDDLIAVNMLLGRTYLDQTPAAMMTDMLSIVPGWASGAVSSALSPATTSVSAEGSSVFGAMRQVAERFHFHTRVNVIEQTVDMGPFGAPSGLRLANLPAYSPEHRDEYPKVISILSMQVVEQGHDIWNSVLPHGAGEGTATLTLEHSTRTEPYEILTAVAPDGRALFYLEDAASIAAYGRRQRVIVDKHAVPLESSVEALEAAANALYDAGVEYLTAAAQPTHTYRVTPGPMKHLLDGVPQFRLGDTIMITYRGRAELVDGSGYLYLDINQNLYLSSYRRTLGADDNAWDLDVQDVLGRREDPARRLADMMDQLWSTQVEPLLADVNLPGEDHPDLPALSYTVTIDARRVFWITKAEITFTILGGGAWAGTITVNGVDRTTELGGPFTKGTEYTVNVKPYIDRLALNTIVFADATEFQIEAQKATSGVGIPGQVPTPP